MASFHISRSVEINRPAETVFQYVTDVIKATEWRPGLVSVRDFSGEPFAVGTKWSDVTKLMGREVVANFEVMELEANRRCKLKMDAGVASGNMTWDFLPVTDESSTFTLNFDGEVKGWLAGLASGLLRNQAEKEMKVDLTNLKSQLESS